MLDLPSCRWWEVPDELRAPPAGAEGAQEPYRYLMKTAPQLMETQALGWKRV
ncbi:hypothetical protein MJ585_01215 [Klebsiella pneumoniae]|nr:hypothetical protein MJ585_01215 [Klebsiella pneumoniae]